MSKHKKRKHKRVADPYDDYMQKRHAYWAACAKKGELTEEQAHTCDELEMFISAVIVFSDISPKDTELFERAWSFRDVFLRFACQPEDDSEPSFYFREEEHMLYICACSMRVPPFSALLWRLDKSFSTNTLFLSWHPPEQTTLRWEEILLLTRGRPLQP